MFLFFFVLTYSLLTTWIDIHNYLYIFIYTYIIYIIISSAYYCDNISRCMTYCLKYVKDIYGKRWFFEL